MMDLALFIFIGIYSLFLGGACLCWGYIAGYSAERVDDDGNGRLMVVRHERRALVAGQHWMEN